MRTLFRRCYLINFAIDPTAMRRRLPTHLEPDIHDGRAYLSIVIAYMERMRPAFLPKMMGTTYTQVVYRAVVRCGSERGVTFLRSDADNRLMVAAGNAFTFFRFHLAKASWTITDSKIAFELQPSSPAPAAISAEYSMGSGEATLPSTSRFANLSEAQAFLTELYAAFGGSRANGVEVVRIKRSPWTSAAVVDNVANYEAMSSGELFAQDEAEIDSVFYVENLEYYWRRLSLESNL